MRIIPPFDDFVDDLRVSGPLYSDDDLRVLYETAMEIEAKAILEIGSHNGTSTMHLANVARLNGGHLFCLDASVSRDHYRQARLKQLKLDEYVTIIICYSPWISPKLITTPLDYIMVDELKNPKCVVSEYHYWMPYLRPGGRIAFHDWARGDVTGKRLHIAIDCIMATDEAFLEVISDDMTKKWGVLVLEKKTEASLFPDVFSAEAGWVDFGYLDKDGRDDGHY